MPAGMDQLGDVGRYIREQRHQAELSLRKLASQAGVSNPYLSQIERGLHEPSVRVLKAIAGALNLSAESLLQQAGMLEGEEVASPAPAPTVEQAVKADPRLSPDQRSALLSVYRSFIDADPATPKPASAPTARPRRTKA